jgi:O-antigen ligase
MAISAVTARNTDLVVRTIILTTLWLMVVFQTAVRADSPARRNAILTASVVSGVIVGLYGLAQISGLLPGAPESAGYPPGISTLGNQNYLSGLAAVLLFPSILLWRQPTGPRRVLAVAATGVFVLVVGLALAMGPLFGVIGSCFLVLPALILVRKGLGRRVPLALGASLLLTVVLGGLLWGEAMKPPPLSGDEPLALHRRIFLDNHGALRRCDWLVAGEMFRQSPLTGGGAGNYAVSWPVVRAKLFADPEVTGLEGHEPLAVRAHNEVFQFLGETGLLGGVWLLAATVAGAWFWRRRWTLLPDDETREGFLLLTAALLVAGIHASVSFPLHLPATVVVLAMIVGLMASPSFAGSGNDSIRRWVGPRFLAVLPAVLALVLIAGSLREFVGDLHIAAGKRYFAAGNLNRASTHLTRGIALSRWPGEGRLYQGLTLVAAGDGEGASKMLAASLVDRPSFEGYLALAEVQIDQGLFTEARRNLTLVENCEPIMAFRFQAAYLTGLAELRQGNRDSARLHFQELLKRDPESQRGWLALGYLEVLADNPGQARIHYQRALEIIDRKLKETARQPGPAARGKAVRLNQHRQAAVRALESVS